MPSATYPVDFCNQNSLRARPRTRRTPMLAADVTRPARAGLGGTSGRGWGPVRLVDCRLRVASRLHPRPSLAARTLVSARHQPSVHEPGAIRHGRTAFSLDDAGRRVRARRRHPSPVSRPRAACAFAGIRTHERALPKLDPLEHPLSRSCFDIGWRARYRRSSPGRSPTTIQATPPRKPCSRETRERRICGPPYGRLR